jgi:hypothetical protein
LRKVSAQAGAQISNKGFSGVPTATALFVIDDTLIVIACFHASRDPSQWQKRA